jgi:hypothetical protein
MLRNVISSSTVKRFGALELISWKYTFKRLNEEYEIAKKKQQALDNLYASGKISQSTRDSFNTEIEAAIAAIEKQQRALVEGMQTKTQELENQIKTLETLLANYEIQHVAGEIDDEIYQREINLLTTGLETTKNELNTIKQVTNQLCPPPPTMEAPAAPEAVAPVIQEVAQPADIGPPPAPTMVEAPPETPAEPAPIEPAPVETVPTEIPVETKAEAAPVESTPVETSPAESTPVETVVAPVETPPVETSSVETTSVEPPPVETTPVKTPPVEASPVVEAASVQTSVETAPVETPTVETVPAEAAAIAPPEPEVHETNEPAPEIAPKEPAITEPAPQEPIINTEETPSEPAPVVEQPSVEAEATHTTPTEVVAEAPKEPAVEVPLDAFEVASRAEQIETKLDKVMEPAVEPVIEPVIVEEGQVPAHPLEAPRAAQTETTHEQNESEAAAETEDSNKDE